MGEVNGGNSRPAVVWPDAARELVRANKEATGLQFRDLIDRLVKETGNSRKACCRFVRRMGVRWKRTHRPWTESDQERLRKQIEKQTAVSEIARKMRRSESSIWHMIQRLGLNVQIGRDSFTKYTLARIMHVRVQRVEDWVRRDLLAAREVEQSGVKRTIIEGEDLVRFFRDHTKEAVGDGLCEERIEFVCLYAFPPSHEGLLDVRASKKERAAYAEQVDAQDRERKPPVSEEEHDEGEIPGAATA